jgi:uncharacterized surface protein with fasciclin (FAS1) repeats
MTKRNTLFVAIAVSALVFTGSASGDCGACGASHKSAATGEVHKKAEEHAKAKMESMDIVETAVAAGSFKTLVAAVKAAGLVETLQGEGPFTVFAPTDEAFDKLPKGTVEQLLKPENLSKLQAILTYHVVPGKVLSTDVVKVESAKTVQGQELKVTTTEDGKVMIDKAQVTQVDIITSNGVIHVIDSVVLPKM